MILMVSFLILSLLYSAFSAQLRRTVFTAPVIFASAGIVMTLWVPEEMALMTRRPLILGIAEAGLVLLLFADASRADLRVLRSVQALPTRLLTIGMLLTIALGLVAALIVFPGLTLWEAAILAAILAPTDAGLGEVIVESPRVPIGIRQALNTEAGLNDGLAVPFLLLFIVLAQDESAGGQGLLLRHAWEQIGLGSLLGVGIGGIGGALLGLAYRRNWMAGSLQGLGLVALPALCTIFSEHLHASMFIAAFVGGLAVRVGFSEAGSHSSEFTRSWGEWLSWFVFFLFGLFFAAAAKEMRLEHFLYAILSLSVIRMLPVALALMGTGLAPATVGFIGWFGPRGLASIVLGLVYLETEAGLAGESVIRLAIMATVLLSIYAHGLTALPGINLYSKRIAKLGALAPEYRGISGAAPALVVAPPTRDERVDHGRDSRTASSG